MTRPLRVNFNNAWHHVMNRGAAFKNIFLLDAHREKFLNLLGEITSQFHIEIHAYCLMDNHYHLLVNTPRGNLSKSIGYLNSVYAEFFNRHNKIDGPLFRGRFKSTVISYDDYLLSVSRYIHLNPIRAKLVEKAQDYKWSSYAAYLNLKPSPSWLMTEKVLNYLKNKYSNVQYQSVVEGVEENDLEQYYKDGRWIYVLGDKNFELAIDSIKMLNPEIAKQKKIHLPTIENIKKVVSDYFQVELSSINKATYMKENNPRSIAIWLSRKVGKCSLEEIAMAFSNSSYSSISMVIHRIEQKRAKNINIATDIICLEKNLMQ